METVKEKLDFKSKGDSSPQSKSVIKPTTESTDIRLSPEQIEEIHTDEYSLLLFYATRVQPLAVAEIKKQFPEPEPKKVTSVMERFVKAGLIHMTPDGKYYSNFPDNYINYSDYRYDSDLEAKKDSKVFRLMKEFTGNREYWKNRTYFSMDAFYTETQTKELQEMFLQIKIKAKEFANQNSKTKSILGLKFRRIKFFDMLFSLAFGFMMLVSVIPQAKAGGNDPTLPMRVMEYQEVIDIYLGDHRLASGGGNDPTIQQMAVRSRITPLNPWQRFGYQFDEGQVVAQFASPESKVEVPIAPPVKIGDLIKDGGLHDGGGGHDPTVCKPSVRSGGGHDPAGKELPTVAICCISSSTGESVSVSSRSLCIAQDLLFNLAICMDADDEDCISIERALIEELSETLTPKM